MWIRVGGIFGVVSVMGFLAVMLAKLPDAVRMWVFFSIPICGILFVAGLGSLMRLHRARVLTDIATLLGIIGLSIMSLMAVVQYVIDISMSQGAPAGKDKATKDMVDWVMRSVNSVQLGMGKSFDVFFLVSIFLFGVSMFSHPRFGRAFGLATCLAASTELILNIYAFPLPPKPDLEVFVALWLLIVAVRMLLSEQYVEQVQARDATVS
jgi:hypothetical protein